MLFWRNSGDVISTFQKLLSHYDCICFFDLLMLLLKFFPIEHVNKLNEILFVHSQCIHKKMPSLFPGRGHKHTRIIERDWCQLKMSIFTNISALYSGNKFITINNLSFCQQLIIVAICIVYCSVVIHSHSFHLSRATITTEVYR